MRHVFRKHGKLWDDEVAQQVKLHVAQENGRKVRILNVIDEFTRECLASEVAFSIKQHDVVELLRYLFLVRWSAPNLRPPGYGPEEPPFPKSHIFNNL